ncbi:MAG: copper amine oxidase N-terminal domain-containing protein [Firmicutes bacterium]|nr:copper amine oxidase N-terminal domain-containing protein [Bacillota bacterium]
MKYKLITFTLIATVLIGSITYAAGEDLHTKNKKNNIVKTTTISTLEEKNYGIIINGVELKLPLDTKEAFQNSSEVIMIPLRSVSEALGYEVKWNEKEQSVELKAGSQWTQIIIGKDRYFFGRMAPMSLGKAPEIINDRTFVPLKFAEKILKAKVSVEDNNIEITNVFEKPLPTLSYNFDNDLEGFEVSFVDLPVDADVEDLYELGFEYKEIPVEDDESKGLYITGHNRSDDLFLYAYKKIGKKDGLKANTKYQMNLRFKMATNVPGAMMGIGGSPGESVYVKAGIVNKEPDSVIDDINHYRLNLDKGNQSKGGKDLALLGNVVKTDGSMDDSYGYKKFETKAVVKTDSEGNAFIIIGVDSGFEGKTEVYFDNITVTYKELKE